MLVSGLSDFDGWALTTGTQKVNRAANRVNGGHVGALAQQRPTAAIRNPADPPCPVYGNHVRKLDYSSATSIPSTSRNTRSKSHGATSFTILTSTVFGPSRSLTVT